MMRDGALHCDPAEKSRVEYRYWNGAEAIQEFSSILLRRPRKLRKLQLKDAGSAVKLLESLQASTYPQGLPQDISVTSWEDRTVVLERRLPTLEVVPSYKDWQYIQSKHEWKGVKYALKDREKLYNDMLFQTALRTIAEVFLATPASAVDVVSLNGIVHTVDIATGHDIKPCVLSVRVNRSKFESLNLDKVVAQACFKSLDGQAGSNLAKYFDLPKLTTYARAKRS